MSLFAAAAACVALSACGQGERASGASSDGSGGDGSSSSSASSASGSGGSGGSLPPPQPLAIMNWNTHNFFNKVDDDKNPSSFDTLSAAEYTQKRKEIAGVLVELDPDIAVLQEIEDEGVLKDLNATIMASGGESYPSTAIVPSKDIREIAVLSRLPIDKVVSHQGEYFEVWGTNGPSFKYTRDCLEVHLTHNGREIVLLGVHFRSKVAPDDPDKRLAEGQHTRDIANNIAKASPEAAIVILGDFNDTPGSGAVTSIVGSGEGMFTDATSLVPEPARWSYNFEGKPELIDHQIANPLFAKMIDPGSVVIPHTAAVDEASDHAPVKATYMVQ